MSDEWFAEDKAFHFCGCFTATMVLYALVTVFYMLYAPIEASRTSLYIAAFGGFAAGILVELFQEVTGEDRFSYKDIVLDALGCLAAWALIYFKLV